MSHFQLQKYLSLPQSGKIIAEYVWIDGSNGLRSKSKVSNFHRQSLHGHCGICEIPHAPIGVLHCASWWLDSPTRLQSAQRYTSW
jgi:hypothetical protein